MPNIIYENLTDKELKTGYWYVTHRVLLKKLGISALAVVSGGLLLYGIVGLVNYYIVDRPAQKALESDLSKSKLDFVLLSEINKPKDLQVLDTQVLKTGELNYDLVTTVVNLNAQWAVESADYYYLIGEEKTNVKTEFILPGSEKSILYLNYQSAAPVTAANLVLENIKWKKVANYQVLAEKVLLFDFKDMAVLSSKKSGLSAEQPVANIRFDILNKSPYNFWEPRFIAFVYKGSKLVAVAPVVPDKLISGEKLAESVNLFQDIPSGATLQIFPDINILDPAAFKGFDNSSGQMK